MTKNQIVVLVLCLCASLSYGRLGYAQATPQECGGQTPLGPLVAAPDSWPRNQAIVEAALRRLFADEEAGFLGDSISAKALQGAKQLWKIDSLGVEWLLASVIADDYSTTRREANIASQLYRLLSGRAAPVLTHLAKSIDQERIQETLGAISQPLSYREDQAVVQILCNAAWLVIAVKADEEFWRLKRYPPWVLANEEIVVAAFHLLGANSRANIRGYALRALPENGESRLEN